jgi:hypothetical protein
MIQFALGPSESVLASKSVFHHFFGLGSGFEWIKSFSGFTSPFVSGVTYSLGAQVSQLSDDRTKPTADSEAVAGSTPK